MEEENTTVFSEVRASDSSIFFVLLLLLPTIIIGAALVFRYYRKKLESAVTTDDSRELNSVVVAEPTPETKVKRRTLQQLEELEELRHNISFRASGATSYSWEPRPEDIPSNSIKVLQGRCQRKAAFLKCQSPARNEK